MHHDAPPADEALVRIWTTLHRDLRPILTAADAVYLQRVLFDMDDDLLAKLLATKLAGSIRFPIEDHVARSVRTGARVRFALEGSEREVTLVHGRGDIDGLLGAASRYGTALFGLRADDAILWPDEGHRLVELRVLNVARCERFGRIATRASYPASLPCASG